MGKTVKDIMKLIEKEKIEMLDFKMVDINGQYRHVTIPAKNFNEETIRTVSALMLLTTAMLLLRKAIWSSFPIPIRL